MQMLVILVLLMLSIAIGMIGSIQSQSKSAITVKTSNAQLLSENLNSYLSAANRYAQSVTIAYTQTNKYSASYSEINSYLNNTVVQKINYQTNIIPYTSNIANQDGTYSIYNYLVVSFNDVDITAQFKRVIGREIIEDLSSSTQANIASRVNISNDLLTVIVNQGTCNNFELVNLPRNDSSGTELATIQSTEYRGICQAAASHGIQFKKYIIFERVFNQR